MRKTYKSCFHFFCLVWLNRRSSCFIFLTLAGALGLAYFFAARLGLALLTKSDGVAVYWPAAGVASGMLIALGPRARGPVVAGTLAATIVANLLGDRTVWSALVFAVCNAGEAVIVAGLIERYFGSAFSLGRLLHVLGLLGAAVVGTAISGIGGTIGLNVSANSFIPVLPGRTPRNGAILSIAQ